MQYRLDLHQPQHVLHASPKRPNPALWVRCVTLLAAPHPDEIIREVPLRRGLNIVWAPPRDDAHAELFKAGLAGHTAGKSTFCRIIRHLLGDSTFASDATTRRIRSTLPHGWMVGEVVVQGEVWVVARPFGLGDKSFCVRAPAWSDALFGTSPEPEIEMREFIALLQSSLVGELTDVSLPAADVAVGWGHVLPWLTRDQECRFAENLEWRRSSELQVDDRNFIVRLLLGFLSPEEQEALKQHKRLQAEQKRLQAKQPTLEAQAEADDRQVGQQLSIDIAPGTPLFREAVDRALLERRQEHEAALKRIAANDETAKALASLEAAVLAEGAVKTAKAEADERLEFESERRDKIEKGERADSTTSLLAARPPDMRTHCAIPLVRARAEGCPLQVSSLTDLTERKLMSTLADDLKVAQASVLACREDVERRTAELETASKTTLAVRRSYFAAQTRMTNQREEHHRALGVVTSLTQALKNAEDNRTKAAKGRARLEDLVVELETSRTLQESLRAQTQGRVGHFERVYDYIVRALLGPEVAGKIAQAGKRLTLDIEEHGSRESAALDTLKIIAFDLAALAHSISGNGDHPRFLVHDGPREADLALPIFGAVMLFAAELERVTHTDEPAFQYIMTTTTEPPESLRTPTWLRLPLSGSPASERLLRRDL